jgi:hypothetical protein
LITAFKTPAVFNILLRKLIKPETRKIESADSGMKRLLKGLFPGMLPASLAERELEIVAMGVAPSCDGRRTASKTAGSHR